MIVLTGGKTGGHVIPLIAIAKELHQEFMYVGGIGFLEEKICHNEKILFLGLNYNKSMFNLIKELKRKIDKKIDAIISTGGFVSVPMLIFGVINKIPIYLIEENVIMGNVNKLFSMLARKVYLSYPVKKMKRKYKIMGQPILKRNINNYMYHKYKIDILIIGGSLGSKPLCDMAKILANKYSVGLVAGRYKDDYISNKYYTFGYVEDLPNLMKEAKIIISRAGAATTSEIFSIGRACILIPSLNTKKNHQYLNAKYFEKMGCCKVLLENDIDNHIEKCIANIASTDVKNEMIRCQKSLIKLDSAKEIVKEIEHEI